MKENPEVRSQALESYKNLNKLTLVGALGVAILVPALAVPALGFAAFDAGQILIIDRVNKKPIQEQTELQTAEQERTSNNPLEVFNIFKHKRNSMPQAA